MFFQQFITFLFLFIMAYRFYGNRMSAPALAAGLTGLAALSTMGRRAGWDLYGGGRRAITAASRAVSRALTGRSRWYRGVRNPGASPATKARQVLGLAKQKQYSSVKQPAYPLPIPADATQSAIIRFSPIGAKADDFNNGRLWFGTLYGTDERFKTMSTLYHQFRVISYTVTVSLALNGTPTSYSQLSFVGRTIRNAPKDYDFFNFYNGTDPINIPGVVWKPVRDSDRVPSLTLTIFPVSSSERNQWFTTDWDASTKANLDWHNGVFFNYCPAIDIALIATKSYASAAEVPINIMVRSTVEFRSGADFGVGDAKTITLETVQDYQSAIRAVKQFEKGAVTGSAPLEPMVTGTEQS